MLIRIPKPANDNPGGNDTTADGDDALVIIYNVLRNFPDAHAAVVEALRQAMNINCSTHIRAQD